MKRILLDECVPWPLARLLEGNHCTSPQRMGWGGIKNGDLLKLAAPEFDLFITSDQNLRYQQNLADRTIAILELSTNDWHSIRAGFQDIRMAVEKMSPSDFVSLMIAMV